ncbi:SDR family oxidoreductase [Nocardia otitidiscaviarum]|uniref:SDR family oxidoreductase n=1 Tax=Nocardia otitidiscaviarum TaxID=1823 RepID=UPI0024568772|nr:NAD(P)H-binding protein [Nocardia otitidiscaviarum]
MSGIGYEPGRLHLLTVGAARKNEGCSPYGIIARSLARQLLDAGERVRIVAESDQSHDWPHPVELISGSITRPLEIWDAFTGVDAVFLTGADPATLDDALALARTAHVGQIVLLSSHGSEYEAAYPRETWFWLAIEKAVERSGIGWTHIRPSAVMGSILEGTYPATGSDWADTIRAEGVVREAFLNTGHYPFIHEDDLAAVAAAALRTDDYLGMTIEAVGMPISTLSRIRFIANAIGRDITTAELTPDESRAVWRDRGWPDSAIDVTLYALEEYATHLEELIAWTLDQSPSVSEIIGRHPLSYAEWALEHAKFFR